jgi:hypothetical protein
MDEESQHSGNEPGKGPELSQQDQLSELDQQAQTATGAQSTSAGPTALKTAVIAGVFGILGALIGGATTGTVSYLTSARQLDSQAQQSTIQFYRDQKSKAYAKLMHDFAEAAQPIHHFAFTFAYYSNNPGSDVSYADFLAAKDAAYQRMSAMWEDCDVIRLIGRSEVVADANDVCTKIQNMIHQVDDFGQQWAKGNLPDPARAATFNQVVSGEAGAGAALSKFDDAATADLQSTK